MAKTNQESPREAFVRLANGRVNKLLDSLDSLGKLGMRRSAYSQEDISKIERRLRSKLDEVMTSFKPLGDSKHQEFSLD
ncbi:hypothetical protein KBZ12_17475 [Cyanobium sp. Cruz CV13-4-11]|jgi:hypothetical protein|uniref:hypothetical protein n=1 Tax=unclassified Cyanobium TaxID=2627006 RepID=UPI0020CCC2BA|nr:MULTISPECIES: hypothetical protein [unclassified Cyanobium]MCP9902361.1 hypothetical protein [Cyanobium sp. Cruz CV11-17]MCP9921231.1 hypothetical protein [Cyanobium sp. Cruz CV13-4-11]